MADGIVQLPFTNTTSGKIMDASELTVGANTVERERLVVADSTSATGLATVTSSAGLTVNISSGTIVSASSGLVQALSTGPLQVLTSGPLTLSGTVTVLSASSGVVQTLTTGAYQILTSGPLEVLSTGPYLLSSAGITQVIPVTSSGINLYTTAGINTVSASSGLVQTLTMV